MTNSDNTSERSFTEMKDEIDVALDKCIDDRSTLKRIRIKKLGNGIY